MISDPSSYTVWNSILCLLDQWFTKDFPWSPLEGVPGEDEARGTPALLLLFWLFQAVLLFSYILSFILIFLLEQWISQLF